ncbi:hypothetical protein ITP53_14975 [Nonomuraea sp. K274]|uniref:Uncharacterized protein n=1 Tax=Nonomuraea cypriaca TaxID=1187855 RepID=A0A931A618_9ACTN|nr:hypothetical protein [Nonomuraea cypriaca]MBF8187016.1 hypothetical protein [Nonomuraea cypriaca]
MTDFPVLRLVTLVRNGAVLGLALMTVVGCGLAGGDAGGGDVAPQSVTSSVTAEPGTSAPVQAESAPAQAESTPDQAGGGEEDPAPVEPGGVLADGSTVSAELTRAGQKDRFTLDLGDAREFYVTDMQGDDIQLQVFADVDDQPLGPSSVALGFGTSIFKLTKAGGHRLEVWGNTNVIGSYSFRIATVKVRTFPAAIGLKIGEGSPAGAGRLDVPGRIDRFEFDSDGATAIKVLGGAGACDAVDMELFDAAEQSVATARQPFPLCGYEFDLPLSGGDGRYALVVRSPTAKTGAYSFQIARAG